MLIEIRCYKRMYRKGEKPKPWVFQYAHPVAVYDGDTFKFSHTLNLDVPVGLQPMDGWICESRFETKEITPDVQEVPEARRSPVRRSRRGSRTAPRRRR